MFCLSVAYSASCQVAVWVCLHHIQHHTRRQCLSLYISDIQHHTWLWQCLSPCTTFNITHGGNVCLSASVTFSIIHDCSNVCLLAPHSTSHTVAVFVSLRHIKSMSHKTVVGASLNESLSTKTPAVSQSRGTDMVQIQIMILSASESNIINTITILT